MKSKYILKTKLLTLFIALICSLYQASANEEKMEEALSQEGIFDVEPGGAGGGQFLNGDDEIRFSGFEQEMKDLVGRVERLEHIITQLKDQIATMEDNFTGSAVSLKALKKDPVKAAAEPAPTPKSNDTENFKDDDKERIEYDKALNALKTSNLNEAEEKFGAFIKDYPKSTLIANAYFWYAESFFRRQNFEKSAVNYLKGFKAEPKGVKSADTLLKLALSLGELGKVNEACSALEKLNKTFPDRSDISKKRSKDAMNKFGCKPANK